MASHWIKMRDNLDTDPKVIRIVRTLLQIKAFRERFGLGGVTFWDVTRDATYDERRMDIVTDVTICVLRRLWIWANQHASKDTVLRGVGLVEADVIAKLDGLGEAMKEVGWIEVLPNKEGLHFPNFHKHNTLGLNSSTGAKSGADRSKKCRDKKY